MIIEGDNGQWINARGKGMASLILGNGIGNLSEGMASFYIEEERAKRKRNF